MNNFDDVTKENIKEHNPNWPKTPHHPYKILTIAVWGSWKTNPLLSLTNQEPAIYNINLYPRDPFEGKY